MADNKYGKLIQKYRLRIGITQSDLAKKLGISANCVSAWEVGRNEPNMGMVCKMADIFGCTVSDLMGLEPFPESKARAMAEDMAEDYKKKIGVDYLVDGSDEKLLISCFRKMDEAQQHRLMMYLLEIMARLNQQ